MNNNIRTQLSNNKQLLLLVILFGIVILTITAMIFFLLTAPREETSSVAPTPIPYNISAPKTVVKYESTSSKKMLDLLKNRPQLSESDKLARQKILILVDNKSGILYTSPLIQLEYVFSANEFQGEIRTTNIAVAKDDAIRWLKDNGISDEGICKLPLIFYISKYTRTQLKLDEIIFNPLPEGC